MRFVSPAPRRAAQILPYGRFACLARGGAIIISPLRGFVGNGLAGEFEAGHGGLRWAGRTIRGKMVL